jgi:hypothetical protein
MANEFRNYIIPLIIIWVIIITAPYYIEDVKIDTPKLVGEWKSIDSNATMSFSNDGIWMYHIKNEDIVMKGKYHVDFSKLPFTLTIGELPNLNHPLYTIFEFIGRDSFILEQFAPVSRLRPLSFRKETSTIFRNTK